MAALRHKGLPAGVLGIFAAGAATYGYFQTDNTSTPLPSPQSSPTATPPSVKVQLGFPWANATGMHNDQCLNPRMVDKPYDFTSAICCFLTLTALSIVYALLITACYTAAERTVPRLKAFVKQVMPPKLLQFIEITSSYSTVAAMGSSATLGTTTLPHNASIYLNGLILITSLFLALYEISSTTPPEAPFFDAVEYQTGTVRQLVKMIAGLKRQAIEFATNIASLNKRNEDLATTIERHEEKGRKYEHEVNALSEKVLTIEANAVNASSTLETLQSELSAKSQAYTSLEQRREDSQKLLQKANERNTALQAEVQKLNDNSTNFQTELSVLRTHMELEQEKIVTEFEQRLEDINHQAEAQKARDAKKLQDLEKKLSKCATFTPVFTTQPMPLPSFELAEKPLAPFCFPASQHQALPVPFGGQSGLHTGNEIKETNETTTQLVSATHTTSDASSPELPAIDALDISADDSTTKAREAAPYQPNDKHTGEKYLCKRGSLCLGDPSEYKNGCFNDRPERTRRYGGDSSNKEKANKKTARDRMLCCDCFSEAGRLLQESKREGVDDGKGAMPEWYYN